MVYIITIVAIALAMSKVCGSTDAAKYNMKIQEFIAEHSRWEVDASYTPEDVAQIKRACLAIHNVARARGLEVKFTSHFFDQLVLKRGFGKITPEMLIRTFGKILNRGLHLFKGKEDGLSLVFYDKENGLNVPFIKAGEGRFTVPTIIRDTRWLGPETKVEI